jgi:hypothetical protein
MDGYDIVLGSADAIADPMATASIVGPLLQASDEAKAIAAVNAQLDELKMRMYRETPMGSPYSPALLEQLDKLGASLLPLGQALDARRAALMSEHAIYCTPGRGESLCSDEQEAAYKAAEKPGYRVKLDGTVIVDNIGKAYWLKDTAAGWAQTLVTCLGVDIPSGAVLTADLTDAQKAEIGAQLEAARVAGLTDEQKLAEAEGAQAQAKAAVVQVASEVGAGISDQAALDAAKAAYQASLAAVNKKYGTSLT